MGGFKTKAMTIMVDTLRERKPRAKVSAVEIIINGTVWHATPSGDIRKGEFPRKPQDNLISKNILTSDFK